MKTGFNTDIEHEGVVYHVQTEDKGLESPLILSLVYAGGEILASKRSRYEDLIASGFDEEVLAKRLKRQHRLICAAINAGRLEELKRMSAPVTEALGVHEVKEPGSTGTAAEAEAPDDDPTVEVPAATGEAPAVPDVSGAYSQKPRTRRSSRAKESPYTVYDPRSQSPLGEAPEKETPLVLTILDEDEYRGGESFRIRVLVQDGTGSRQKPLMGVSVSLKILGTAFRPQIYSVRTERDGIATVSAEMPDFTSGRAAVLIRAVSNGETTELRRVIHPAQ